MQKHDIKKLETKKLPPLAVINKNFSPRGLPPLRTIDMPITGGTRASEATIIHLERGEDKGIAREAANNVSRSTIDLNEEGRRTPRDDTGTRNANMHSFNPLLLNDQQRSSIEPPEANHKRKAFKNL